jgi:hypothetical protein
MECCCLLVPSTVLHVRVSVCRMFVCHTSVIQQTHNCLTSTQTRGLEAYPTTWTGG